jgi:hypothetical protein
LQLENFSFEADLQEFDEPYDANLFAILLRKRKPTSLEAELTATQRVHRWRMVERP